MEISYSFHLSSKRHAVTNTNKVSEVSRHNLRQYMSEHYDRNKIEILRGSDKSILDDVKHIYHKEFDAALARYNSGKRSDRVISDYLEHVSKSRNDVACEIIIQLGDREFWEGKTLEERKQMSYIFNQQLTSLEFLVPEFRIASAVIHYDERSPHMHIVGVPVAEGYKRGMKKQAAKTKIFTPERLRELQTKLHADAERQMQLPQYRDLFSGIELKEKEKGRNKDIPKQSLAEYYALRQDIAATQKKLVETRIEQQFLDAFTAQARQEESDLENKTKELQEILQAQDDEHRELEQEIVDKKNMINLLDAQIAARESKRDTLKRYKYELDQKRQELSDVSRMIDAQKKELDTLNSQIAVKRDDLSVSELLSKMAEKKAAELNRQSEYCQEKIVALKAQEQSLNSQIDRKRSELADAERQAVEDLDRQVEKRQEELNQIDARITGLKEQRQSLSSQIDNMRSELAKSERLAGEVTKKRRKVEELDRQVEDRQEELMSMAAIDEHEMHSILNNAITKNLVSRIVKSVCKLLSEWGIIRTDPSMLAVKLTKPVLTDLGESMDGFLQDVKEHMLKSLKKSAQKKRKTR